MGTLSRRDVIRTLTAGAVLASGRTGARAARQLEPDLVLVAGRVVHASTPFDRETAAGPPA